jgi:hypothetical protein
LGSHDRHTEQTAVLRIVEEAAPRETSTDRIERVLAEFAAIRPLIERR